MNHKHDKIHTSGFLCNITLEQQSTDANNINQTKKIYVNVKIKHREGQHQLRKCSEIELKVLKLSKSRPSKPRKGLHQLQHHSTHHQKMLGKTAR